MSTFCATGGYDAITRITGETPILLAGAFIMVALAGNLVTTQLSAHAPDTPDQRRKRPAWTNESILISSDTPTPSSDYGKSDIPKLQDHLGHNTLFLTSRYHSTLAAEDSLRIQRKAEFG